MNILLVSSYIFGYMKFVVEEWENQGHKVDVIYFDDIPFEYKNLSHKIIAGAKKIFGHHERKLVREKHIQEAIGRKRYDLSLVVHGHYMNKATNEFIQNRSSYNVAYFFDSIAKMPGQLKIIPYFDKVYSYEPEDCKKFNFKFLSNFIPSKDYKTTNPSYIIFNVSGIDERLSVLKRLTTYLIQQKISYRFLLFSKNPVDNFEQINRKIDVQEILPMIRDCKIMLDIQRPIQKGLTFRVFEALGNDKKLITTNKDIVNYDFYNSQNIFLLNPKEIEIPKDFIQTKYKPVDKEIIQKYSVENWCKIVTNLD